MKSRLFYPFLLFAVTFLFTQCTVEKRLYTKGWSVEWRHRYKSAANEEQPVRSVVSASEAADAPEEKNGLAPSVDIRQLETAEPLVAPSESAARATVTDDFPVNTPEETAPASQPEKTASSQQSDDETEEEPDNERNVLGVVVALVLGILVVIGIVLVVGSLGVAGAGADLAILLILSILIGIGIVAAVLFAVNVEKATEDTPQKEQPRKKKKEKTPEEEALLKRKGAIVMGVFAAAIAGILVALKLS
jgi:hypothetical protein